MTAAGEAFDTNAEIFFLVRPCCRSYLVAHSHVNPRIRVITGAGPHAVTAAGSATYAYDANGNMTSGAGRTIAWTSFNKPSSITSGSETTSFVYGPSRARVKQVIGSGHSAKTVRYVGGLTSS